MVDRKPVVRAALGDFTTDRRVLLLAAMAAVIGAIAAFIAYALLWLIAVITNLAFFGRLSSTLTPPSHNALGAWILVIPVVGGLIVGVMARYGSEKIRGHGIPEAMEAILLGGSRIEPKVAVLKPVSSAIAIGTGGPFGAEGPIIMTGGAFGSLFAQFFHLTAAERKTLLVAGAAAGMSATFNAPVAATLLAVELLLFEWKPRSFIPVATAAAVAAAVRPLMFPSGALFPVAPHAPLPWNGLLFCVGVGLVAGVASSIVTAMVYGFEDAFRKIPIHWMWWPAVGGLFIGIGGLIEPRALGVGYDNIRALLAGNIVGTALISLLVVKAIIWSLSLGSGTSGGVLAPLLIMGGAMGGLEAHLIGVGGPGLWALIAMGAMLGGTMGAPLTAVIFALELTHDVNAFLPLLIACTASFLVSVLFMKRSILTEKVARRGHHLSREYSVDPYELLRVAEVMNERVDTLPASMTLQEATALLTGRAAADDPSRWHQGYPVLTPEGAVVGVLTRGDIVRWSTEEGPSDESLADLVGEPVVGYPDEPVGRLADRMAAADVGRTPIVDDDGKLIGIVSRRDLLRARSKRMSDEVERARVLGVRRPNGEVSPSTSESSAATPRG
ncbi:MAG: chloride channel protein [Actinomycetota bacterium]